jgi:threonine dehydrogenase-like Zn-dependent dehydrogenase
VRGKTNKLRGNAMRAAILRKGEIVVDDLPEPKPGKGQVLVKTLACGICGTDLHARVHADLMNTSLKHVPWRKTMDLSKDIVFGHEFCGEIIAYGPDTPQRLEPGTRVVSVPRTIVDGRIEGVGYSDRNVGGYAEKMLLGEPFLLPVPDGLSSAHASLCEPLAVGVHAVEKARMIDGEVPLVIGCGPVGLAVIAALRLKRKSVKLGPIIASDFSPKRREIARVMGADVVVDPAVQSPYAVWSEHAKLTPEEIAKRPPSPVTGPATVRPQVVFECVGVPGMIQSVFEGAAQDARVVVVGVSMEADRQEPLIAIFKELSLQYVFGYNVDEFAIALKLLADGDVDGNALVTGTVGLDGVAEAFTALAKPQQHIKIVIEPGKTK